MKNFYLIIAIVMGVSVVLTNPSSSSNLEDGFVQVVNTNAHAVSLFPKEFTPQQISRFYAGGSHDIEDIGTLSIDKVFKQKVMPNSVQILTGKASDYANKIKFTGAVEVEDGVIRGIYEYSSSYEALYNLMGYAGTITFPVYLRLDPSIHLLNPNNVTGRCRIFNMKGSLLGDKDFLSSANQLDPANGLIPLVSLYNVFTTDAKFCDQTNEVQRLANNTKNWLLLLNQLVYGQLHKLDNDQRDAEAEALYDALLTSKGYSKDAMTKEKYKDCMLSVRRGILEYLGLEEGDIPLLGKEMSIPLCEGKVFLLAPDRGAPRVAF